ncbi:MAG: hypothetical protein QOK47_1088 [Actinomycetota bacterium]|nr:hypothetical protein [Actinomycetota bacterium]
MGRSVIADSLRVIVVDDIPSVRLLLRSTLPLHGIEIAAEAETGAEAIVLAKSQKPDAIILDVHMPDMSGMDVVTQLKKQNPGCKIVMYSNYDEKHIQEEAMSRGADAYVDKLAPVSDVATTLERVCAAT